MADFTLNAPGTTVNPYTPSSILILLGTLQSEASGIRPGSLSSAIIAHNVSYGATITTTATLATISSGDSILVGAVVRTGGNAKAFIGASISFAQIALITLDAAGSSTPISTANAITWATSDVFSTTVAISGGTATVSASQNGSPFTFNINTTTNFTGETSLAAGMVFDPENNNGTRISQFTGTGVSGGGGPSVAVLTANLFRRKRLTA
jgi:hypothetical protein